MQRTIQRYILAAGIALLAAAVRVMLHPVLHENAPYTLLFPAVIAAVWYCGTGPGIVSLICGVVASRFWLIPAGVGATLEDHVALGIHVVVSAGLIWIVRHTVVDIAARKTAEAKVRLLAAGLEATPNAVSLSQTDPDGTIVWVNEAFTKLTGYSEEEAIGKTHHFLSSGQQSKEFYRNLWQTISRGEVWRGELINRRKDGTLYHEEMGITPVWDEQGKITHFLAVKQDITARKRAEEALRQSEQRLLEEARRKDEFLAILGHELRNPLAPIRNAIHFMNRVGQQDVALKRTQDIIERQVSHMARLLEDLLDVARLKRGKVLLKKEVLDLTEAVRLAAEDHRAELESNEITLEITVPQHPIHVNADRARVAQIVGNLLHNSRKFTHRGGHVWVQVCASESHGRALVSVRDTGDGMAPELLERVFEPFLQAESSPTRVPGGLGLGLALVKEFVGLHGGSVQAQSDGVGHGSEFIISLPTEGPTIAPRAQEQFSGPTGGWRVLIVEDNRDAAESLRLVLEMSGHPTEEAQDALEGLEKARQFGPDIILCDIGLPGEMDGYAFARAVRQDAVLLRVHLVALTGYGTEEDRQRAKMAGFDLHLTKPVDPERLERIIHDFSQGASKSRAAGS